MVGVIKIVVMINCKEEKIIHFADFYQQVAGRRTVPIEIGPTYLSPHWRQELMSLDKFISEYIEGRPKEIGYLAQVRFFSQFTCLTMHYLVSVLSIHVIFSASAF
tara:strand:+ start:630 stop:944 length:315 start_codon:yes stop_codon:yes gene_type:complete